MKAGKALVTKVIEKGYDFEICNPGEWQRWHDDFKIVEVSEPFEVTTTNPDRTTETYLKELVVFFNHNRPGIFKERTLIMVIESGFSIPLGDKGYSFNDEKWFYDGNLNEPTFENTNCRVITFDQPKVTPIDSTVVEIEKAIKAYKENPDRETTRKLFMSVLPTIATHYPEGDLHAFITNHLLGPVPGIFRK